MKNVQPAMIINQVESILNHAISRASLMGDLLANGASALRVQQIKTSAGYPETVTVEDYYNMWKRLGMARRIIRAFPKSCWRKMPHVYEVEDNDVETPWEKEFEALNKRVNLLAQLAAADILTGVGHFGVVLLGIADQKPFDRPVDGFDGDPYNAQPGQAKAKYQLNYVRPYSEAHVSIEMVEADPTNPRFGQPTYYKIQVGNNNDRQNTSYSPEVALGDLRVHWHRVIHLTDETDESVLFSAPRLQPVYDDLIDVLKISAGSPEMYWQGGLPGLTFKLDPGYEAADQESITRQMEEYSRNLRRYISTVGVTVSTLAPSVVDPTPHWNQKMDAIAAATEIPKRILLGTEEGRLAGDQDGENWAERVQERQTNHLTPHVVVRTLKHLQRAGVLARCQEIFVDWEVGGKEDPTKQAQVSLTTTQALAAYMNSGSESILPLPDFLHLILKFPMDVVQAIMKAVEDAQAEADKLEEELADEMGTDEDGNPLPPADQEVEEDGNPLPPADEEGNPRAPRNGNQQP